MLPFLSFGQGMPMNRIDAAFQIIKDYYVDTLNDKKLYEVVAGDNCSIGLSMLNRTTCVAKHSGRVSCEGCSHPGSPGVAMLKVGVLRYILTASVRPRTWSFS